MLMPKYLESAHHVFELPSFRWTLERYHAAIEAGILNEYDKVELLFGKLVPVSPVGIVHGKTVNKINRLFINRFPEHSYMVGIQNPVTLIDDSEPEPDIYLAKGAIESYTHHPYPEDILLIIEVADTTLRRDRTAKKFSYAVAGISEYWIIDVFDRQVERYTKVNPDDGTYDQKEVFRPGDTFTSSHLGSFDVDDLLVGNS